MLSRLVAAVSVLDAASPKQPPRGSLERPLSPGLSARQAPRAAGVRRLTVREPEQAASPRSSSDRLCPEPAALTEIAGFPELAPASSGRVLESDLPTVAQAQDGPHRD